MLFEPVVGVVLAALFLAEGLHPLQVVGGATILAAALIVQRGTRTPSDAPVVAPAPGGP
jgi:drug/metabolite transporter (DMT)-like permease